MRTKAERDADYERRDAAITAKYNARMAEIKERSAELREQSADRKRAAPPTTQRPFYTPSMLSIIVGVLFPPYGLYQWMRLLTDQMRIYRSARAELARVRSLNS